MGLDVGDRFSQLGVVDQDGVVIQEDRIPTTRVVLCERLAGPPARVVLEAGTHAGWMSRELTALGHEVLVANSRKLRWLYHNEHKTDRVDATYLARVGRWDPTLLAPIRVRSAGADGALRLVRARASLVRARTRLINHVRGALTALAFVLTVDDPRRFGDGRAVGAYFGLCPRRADSGAHRPQLGITKCGDGLVRQLLVQAAHYILGPFGPDCRLR